MAVRRGLSRTAAVIVGIGLAMTATTPAFAAIGLARVHQGGDYASIRPSDRWVEVCDMEADGNGVYGEFDAGSAKLTLSDPNGSSAGCGNGTAPYGTYRFRVCEKNLTCSAWVQFGSGKVTEFYGNSYASLNPDNGWIEVCNREAGTSDIYATYHDSGGWRTYHDTSPNAGGCTNATLVPVGSFQVCKSGVSCADWVDVWWTP